MSIVYDVIFKCGHAGRVTLYGEERDRVSWIKNNKLCPDCDGIPVPGVASTALKIKTNRGRKRKNTAKMAPQKEPHVPPPAPIEEHEEPAIEENDGENF